MFDGDDADADADADACSIRQELLWLRQKIPEYALNDLFNAMEFG